MADLANHRRARESLLRSIYKMSNMTRSAFRTHRLETFKKDLTRIGARQGDLAADRVFMTNLPALLLREAHDQRVARAARDALLQAAVPAPQLNFGLGILHDAAGRPVDVDGGSRTHSRSRSRARSPSRGSARPRAHKPHKKSTSVRHRK